MSRPGSSYLAARGYARLGRVKESEEGLISVEVTSYVTKRRAEKRAEKRAENARDRTYSRVCVVIRQLTPDESNVLNRGLGFVPTPNEDFFRLHAELAQLFRKIRLHVFFKDKPAESLTPDSGLKKPSTFVPPSAMMPSEILTFEKAVLADISHLRPKQPFVNIPKREKQALQLLSSDADIVIKQADKGGAIVVMNTTDYRSECCRLLSDTTYYTKITDDPTRRLQMQIRCLLEEARNNSWISPKEAEFLDTKDPIIPYFYCLPKIHKGVLPPPGRPIVSGIGSVLEPLSIFCDHFLQPLVKHSSTYLQDTKDVLNLIDSINNSGSVQGIITLDVEALYTNIPQEATLEVVESALLNDAMPITTPISFIMQCATLALTENYFKFEEQFFHQIRDTSMGSTFAPSLACLYMFDFEKKYILPPSNPFHNEIKLWKRYIDDILVIWQGPLTRVDPFTTWVNSLDPFLKFTSTASSIQLPFLDLMISINENGRLVTSTYHKPTDRNSLLLYESHHPKALRDNLPVDAHSLALLDKSCPDGTCRFPGRSQKGRTNT
ncbi:hypothetical protein NDU88_007282 [Pleurodeles waltl]|uniref:Reverse transcriptase domain-containing protein n=1 Tax=Pleurodeles waltl TaxID=8319 RepID=A0AAV7VQ11_PLEWA|nr:hypothetical protein NDU88_007282 [Pleurodeles waltl]